MTLKIQFVTLFGRFFRPSNPQKCGFRVGGLSFLRFSCFLSYITFLNDFCSILGLLGAPFWRLWGVLGGDFGALGAI